MSVYSLGERHPQFLGNFWIAPGAVVVGNVILHHNVSLWFGAVARGDNEPIVIGENTNIQDGAVLHNDLGIPLTIGANVTVGHHAMLHGCEVGDGTLIGIKAAVLNNAKIGRDCLIGANTLIPERKVIPDRSLVVGSPGRIVRELTDQEVENLRRNAADYVLNWQRYIKELKVHPEQTGLVAPGAHWRFE